MGHVPDVLLKIVSVKVQLVQAPMLIPCLGTQSQLGKE